MKTIQIFKITLLFYFTLCIIHPSYTQQKKTVKQPVKKQAVKFTPPVIIPDENWENSNKNSNTTAPTPGDKLSFNDLEWMIAQSETGIETSFLAKKKLKLQKTVKAANYYDTDTIIYTKGNEKLMLYITPYKGFYFAYSTPSRTHKDSLLQTATEKGYTIANIATFVKQASQQPYLQTVTSYNNYPFPENSTFTGEDNKPMISIESTDGELLNGTKYYSLTFSYHGIFKLPLTAEKEGITTILPPSEAERTSADNPEYVCHTCDTIRLTAGKPVIIFIETKSHYDKNEQNDSVAFYRIFSNRDVENYSLVKNYYAIKADFPDTQFRCLDIYKTCYLQFDNQTKQAVSLLDGSKSHTDFIYWSGKAEDNILKTSWYDAHTALSRATGLYKQKPGYQYFLQDSLAVERYMKLQAPVADKGVADNMNTFLLQSMENSFPLPFINIQKVKRLLISSNDDDAATVAYNFNENGQLTSVNNYSKSDGGTSISFTYKNGLPFSKLDNRQRLIEQYAYLNDTLIVVKQNYVRTYKNIGRMFFILDEYKTSEADYRECNLRYYYYQLNPNDKRYELCQATYRDRAFTNYKKDFCVTNTNWQLPLTVDGYTYELDENGDLNVKQYNRKSTYKIRDGKLITDEKRNVYYDYY